ncbi:MAG: hypothetical protein IKL70_03110 [Oscillospiraceae bacterium]|nr:hypothetical protein [Oscillospiraceae bacterium]
MALAKIVGVEPVNYIRKSDGSEVSGITLYFNYNVSSVWGEKCGETYIGQDKPLYEQFVPYKDKPKELLGKKINIERNDRGFIEDLVLEK